jgi:ATP-dependent Clp protease ATP-binding subunit ClpA
VLDDGRLTDGQGRVVSFRNAIIIMTSNVGSQFIREFNAQAFAKGENGTGTGGGSGSGSAGSGKSSFSKFGDLAVAGGDKGDMAARMDAEGGFEGMFEDMMGDIADKFGMDDLPGEFGGRSGSSGGSGKKQPRQEHVEIDDQKKLERAIDQALRATFRPEFLNRIDDIIIFHSLDMSNLDAIVELQLADVQKRLADRKISVEVGRSAAEQLGIDGFDPVFGARPLKRLIQHNVVDLLANEIVAGNIHEGDKVLIDLDDRMDYAVIKQ